MPKIIQILNRFVIGGPSVIITNLTKQLAPEFETLLIVGAKEPHEKEIDIEDMGLFSDIVEIKDMKRAISPLADYKSYLAVKKVIRDFKPDIVHTHSAKPGIIGRMAAHDCHVKTIVHTFHGHAFHSYFSSAKTKIIIQAERYLAKISDGIIAISAEQYHELAHVYKICPESKLNLIPIGLNLSTFSENKEQKRNKFREKFLISENDIVIAIIGRIVDIKNHVRFVQIAHEVLKHTKSNIKFLVIGDGDMRIRMEEEIAKKGIDYSYYPAGTGKATIVCTSWIKEIGDALAGIDIVILTSDNEGTPVSLIEAQAAKIPVVATGVGGVKDTVINNASGFLVPPDDISLFAEKLLQLIHNQEMREEMGRKGYLFVSENFSDKKMLNNTVSCYHRLMNK